MEHEDARTLPAAAQEEKRKLAVRLCKSGMNYTEIAEAVGVHRVTVSKWCRGYAEQGAVALKSRTRGRAEGTHRRLSPAQEARVRQLICDKTPDQLKLPFALWTRRAVGLLVKQLFGIKLPVRTVGSYLERWGFTPQKPLKRAYEQRPAEVKAWLDTRYPAIAARAKAEDAEIHWGDETGLRNDDHRGRGYAPIGKTPVITLVAKRESINLISTVTNQGKVRFMIYDGGMNVSIMIRFMSQLIKDAKRKVFLILDNLRVHHAKLVKAWLGDHKDQIEVFYLPAYAPELNPDEYLNCDLKGGVFAKAPTRSKAQLTKAARSHLKMLQRRPARVTKYFQHNSIQYAA